MGDAVSSSSSCTRETTGFVNGVGSRLPWKKLVCLVNAYEMEEDATGRVKYWQIFKCVGGYAEYLKAHVK